MKRGCKKCGSSGLTEQTYPSMIRSDQWSQTRGCFMKRFCDFHHPPGNNQQIHWHLDLSDYIKLNLYLLSSSSTFRKRMKMKLRTCNICNNASQTGQHWITFHFSWFSAVSFYVCYAISRLSLILLDFHLEFERVEPSHKSVNYGNYEDIFYVFRKNARKKYKQFMSMMIYMIPASVGMILKKMKMFKSWWWHYKSKRHLGSQLI